MVRVRRGLKEVKRWFIYTNELIIMVSLGTLPLVRYLNIRNGTLCYSVRSDFVDFS